MIPEEEGSEILSFMDSALIEEFLAKSAQCGFLVLLISSFLENIFPPFPGDTVTVYYAFLAGRGKISPWFLAAVIPGSLASIMLVYLLGRGKARRWIEVRNPFFFRRRTLQRTERLFERYGDRLIITGRFLPSVRAFINLLAGMAHVAPAKMISYSLVGLSLWNGFLFVTAYGAGRELDNILHILKIYYRSTTILVVLIAVILAIALKRRARIHNSGHDE